MTEPNETTDLEQFDPTFVHSRREALIIFTVWAAALLWAVPYCSLYGYGYDPNNFRTILGMPAWVFWGLAVPWLVADVFTAWFCFFYMADDDLGADDESNAADRGESEASA